MAKKIKITEHQLSLIVNHINKNKDSELLEEGWKDVVLGLTLLANVAGVKAQTVDVSPDTIEKASKVQSKLPSKITNDNKDKLLKYFNAAEIEMSDENLEKLKDVDSERIDTFNTKYAKTAKQKIKQGYAIERVEITKDTLISELPAETTIDTTINVDLSDNLFGVGEYKMDINSENAYNLGYVVSMVEENGGKVISVTIDSSTDKQRLSDELRAEVISALKKMTIDDGEDDDFEFVDDEDLSGNKGLSTLRNNEVRNYLVNDLNVDSSVIKQNILYDQGKGKDNAATPQDPSARYVIVKIVVSYDVAGLPSDSTVGKVAEDVYFVLIKKVEKTGSKKSGGKKYRSNIKLGKNSCKFNFKDSVWPCQDNR